MMKRREFLSVATLFLLNPFTPSTLWAKSLDSKEKPGTISIDVHIKDYLNKIKNFDQNYPDDVYLEKDKMEILASAVMRLQRIQATIGYGHFCLLSFDSAVKIANDYSRVGSFPKKELTFLEMIFYEDCKPYGFFGEKPFKQLTAPIETSEVVKVRGSGNYLFNGAPLQTYKRIREIIGNSVILTSGIRGVMKQFLLFLNKAYINQGNLSIASRSLAPPGYSFHSVGDFDVGQYGFGKLNFTSHFTETQTYKKLKALGYLQLRYPEGNHLGVRYEPWHVKVKS